MRLSTGSMSESEIEKAVCKHATSKGVLVRKNEALTFKGRPDRIFHYKGYTWYIEFKAKTGKLSEPQKREIARLTEQAICCHVIFDVDTGKSLIDYKLKMIDGWLDDSEN